MSAAAARTPARRRRALPWLIALALIVLIVAGLGFWLNTAAAAATNVLATLTVYRPSVSVAHDGCNYSPAATGAVLSPGDSIMTDAKGRGAIQLPDGTLMRLAGSTEITLTAAHFARDGNLHDATIFQKLGRTLANVQHLVSGATFKVSGQSATASVRGTKFEVVVTGTGCAAAPSPSPKATPIPQGTMTVKLFEGELDFDGKNHVHLTSGQQATADPQGNVGPPGPILPDPDDPFDVEIETSDESSQGTTPGTEQVFIGPPIHNGETQTYTYSFAGGGIIKAALGWPGSAMQLKVQTPDGQTYLGTGPSPIVVIVNNAPAGIYTILVIGVSGLGIDGETAFLSVAALEPCVSADIDQNGAVRRGLGAQDLVNNIDVSGLSNLDVTVEGNSLAGAIITGKGTYNGVSWAGTVVLFMHGGLLQIVAVDATVFGVQVPAEQVITQIGTVIGQDPANINLGFQVDRLFTCNGFVMIDGRTV
jgi:hypothetical protein